MTKKRESSIPAFLQRKLYQKEEADTTAEASSSASPGRTRHRRGSVDQQRSFTAPQLEDFMWRTSETIVACHKQIQRGEETYYEDTSAHGSSLYKGFDTFIDARDIGTVSGPPTSSRRMPGDFRWFSSSCSNIARHMKRQSFVPRPPSADGAATSAPLSGQKRPAEANKESSQRPSKERKTNKDSVSAVEEAEMTKEDEKKPAESSTRRTTRKRKANAHS